jgi:hypothetical protein
MTLKNLLAVGLLTLCATACASNDAAQAGRPGDDMTEDEIMAAMMELGQPGEAHAAFQESVGSWNTTMNIYTVPDAPPMTMTGTSELETIMGGRFLVEHYSSDFMGTPFEGMMTQGYDNLTERYFILWIDNMATGYSLSHGERDEHGVIVAEGMMRDVRTPDGRPFKMVLTSKGKDAMFMEMFDYDESGMAFKTMDITYERK